MKTKTELEAEKLGKVKAARDIADAADQAGRNLTADEMKSISTLVEEARGIHGQILELDGAKAMLDDLNILGQTSGDLAKTAGARVGEGQTLGEKFVSAPEFKSWLSTVAPNGQVPESAKGIHSPALAFGMKDLVTGASDTSAGALVPSDWRGLLDGLGQFQRPLTIRNLITVGQTGSDQVEYARVTGFTNNAGTVAEATSALPIGVGEGTTTAAAGGRKPESGLALAKVTANVKTLAHWIPATKRALSDAAQIRTLIDQFLRYGLDEELEDQILTGDGEDENFDGILETSGIQEAGFDTDILVTARKARTLVRTEGRAVPTAYVLNPADNERFDLMRDENGVFYFGGPAGMGVQTLWGLPRVESEAVPEGTGIVADWRQAVLWDREQAAIQVSDSHADFFVRNLVAMLAEMRAAFGVLRPKAFVTFPMEASGSGS